MSVNEDKSEKQDIFDLDFQNFDTTLQIINLLNNLLKSNFVPSQKGIRSLQENDLQLRQLYLKTQNGDLPDFFIKDEILYKKTATHNLLCMPKLLLRPIIDEAHTCKSFHFTANQLLVMLKSMLFHPHLAQTIKESVNTCLICTLSRPKLERYSKNFCKTRHR